MSDFREEAEKIADELHCDWFDREDGIEIIKAALKKSDERGRREENEAWQKIVEKELRYEEISGRGQALAILQHGRARMEEKP